LQTQLITLEVPLTTSPDELRAALPSSDVLRPDELRSHIEAQLRTQGDPLRWAITSIDPNRQLAHVEAVITQVTEQAFY